MNKTWYAIYIKSRQEKKVDEELKEKGIDSYLPLQKVLKQWSDRKKWIEVPLFNGYIFVHINKKQYYNVLNINGVVRYVTFSGKAVPIPPQQISAIKQYLDEEEIIQDEQLKNIKPGDFVEVIKGSLIGLKGNVVNWQGKHKLLVEIDGINHKIMLTIPVSYMTLIK